MSQAGWTVAAPAVGACFTAYTYITEFLIDVTGPGLASAAFNVGIAGGALAGGLLLPVYGVRSTALAGAFAACAAAGLVLAERFLLRPVESPVHLVHPLGEFRDGALDHDAGGHVTGRDRRDG